MKTKIRQPVLIIHGGAGSTFKKTQRPQRLRHKIRHILNAGYKKLCGSNALEAVTYIVSLFEEDAEFNAGRGAVLQTDGMARLSASVMDGQTMSFAAVINLEKIKNPVLVAKALLNEKSRVLAGRGALAFARQQGFKTSDLRTPRSVELWKKRRAEGSDTVGACALDREGHLAAATSTGGRGMERPGRVSDSAMPVANFADKHCAISATGHGESIIDEGLALRIGQRMIDGQRIGDAFRKTFREVRSRGRRMGAIGIDRKGRVAYETTTEVLIYGWRKGRKSHLFKS